MPIPNHLRHFYSGPAWEATRARILKRARNRCEQCGKRNHRHIWVIGDKQLRAFGIIQDRWLNVRDQYWCSVKGGNQRWHSCEHGGAVVRHIRITGKQWESVRQIRVVLTIGHLNHTPGDDRDVNLEALCGFCHLNYDRMHHKTTRSKRKDAARPLWGKIFEDLGGV